MESVTKTNFPSVAVFRENIGSKGGPGSSVSIGLATGLIRGSNPGGGEIFRISPHRLWGTSSLLYNGYRVFLGGKERPGRDADPSPLSSTVVKKRWSYSSTPHMGRSARTEPQCLYTYFFTYEVEISVPVIPYHSFSPRYSNNTTIVIDWQVLWLTPET